MFLLTALVSLANYVFRGVAAGTTPWLLLLLLNFALGILSLSFMMGGGGYGGGGHGGHHHGPQSNGLATLKTPPTWGPEMAQHYPFIQYVNDVILWTLATDMDRLRQGPAVAMQLSGAAKLVVRQITESPHGLQRIQQGEQLPDGTVSTGVMVLLQAVGQRFAPLEMELTTRAMHDMMNFRRLNGETIDMILTRFDTIRNRAVQNGGMLMTTQGLAWILMKAVGLSTEQWDRVLDTIGGHMPLTEEEFQRICDRVRRMGHMQEPGAFQKTGAGDGFFTEQNPNGQAYFFPTFDQGTLGSAALGCSGGGPPPQPQMQTLYQAPGNQAFMSNTQCLAQGFSNQSQSAFQASAFDDPEFLQFPDEQCQACGHFYDEEFSSGTESDDGEPIPQAAIYQVLAQGNLQGGTASLIASANATQANSAEDMLPSPFKPPLQVTRAPEGEAVITSFLSPFADGTHEEKMVRSSNATPAALRSISGENALKQTAPVRLAAAC
jgi:hypothetical protein